MSRYKNQDFLLVKTNILCLDQISRHVYRENREKVDKNTKLAVQFCLKYFQESDLIEDFTDEHLIFMLMPLKHDNISEYFLLIEKNIELRSESGGTSSTIQRFYRDSKKKYLISLNEEAVKEPKRPKFMDYTWNYTFLFIEKFKYFIYALIFVLIFIVTIICGTFTTKKNYAVSFLIVFMIWIFLKYSSGWGKYYSLVCEHTPFEYFDGELSEEKNVPLIKRMYSKVVDMATHGNGSLTVPEKCIDVVVSLSGGVDSMILCYIFKKLQEDLSKVQNSTLSLTEEQSRGLSETSIHLHISAVHINYRNRPESDLEQNFVEDYCNRLGIPLYVRVIDGIKRGTDDRKWYEQVTRDIRFDLYRRLIDNLDGDRGFIVLGHIRDDAIENVFTNFTKGQHIFDLKKIHEFDEMHGVRVKISFFPVDKMY